MARRWYIAAVKPPIPNSINDGYHSEVSELQATYRMSVGASIPTFTSGPNLGKPLYRFCLGQVATLTMAVVANVSNLLLFPDYSLDARMDGMDPDVRAGLKQSIEAYVLDDNGKRWDASVVLDDAASFRDLINSLGSQLEPGWLSQNQAEPPEPTT